MSKLAKMLAEQKKRDEELRKAQEEKLKPLQLNKTARVKRESIALESLLENPTTDYLGLNDKIQALHRDRLVYVGYDNESYIADDLTNIQVTRCLLIINFMVKKVVPLRLLSFLILSEKRSRIRVQTDTLKKIFGIDYPQVYQFYNFIKEFPLTEIKKTEDEGYWIITLDKLLHEADYLFRHAN